MSVFGGTFYPRGVRSEMVKSKDTLWIQIVPMSMNLNVNERLNSVSGSGVPKSPMWFLMPMEYDFNIEHSWSELVTPAAALREVASKFSNQYQMAKGTMGGKFEKGSKADNPMMYEGSTRRQFKISFEFSVHSNAKSDVYDPIQSLIEYSCPEFGGGLASFNFPYIFRLQTYTGNGDAVNIVSVKTAALTSVQPGYKGPWLNGYPSSATVALDFVDLNPLYRGLMESESARKITIK